MAMAAAPLLAPLETNDIVLVVLGKDTYRERLDEILAALSAAKTQTCYVLLNLPYASAKRRLAGCCKDASKFLFVDTLTSAVGRSGDASDCLFVDDPHALTDLGLAMSQAFEEKDCDILLLDAVSTLLIYHPRNVVVMFSHNAITKLRMWRKKGIFLLVGEDAGSELMKDLVMFSDAVIDLAGAAGEGAAGGV